MPRLTIDEIFDDELIGEVVPITKSATDEDRILQGFEEINQFIDHHKRVPGEGDGKPSVTEKSLQFKLQGLRKSQEAIKILIENDRHNLLAAEEENLPSTLDEILDLDDELLTTPSDNIFTLRHVHAPSARPDWVSKRQRCVEMDHFQPILDSCVRDLESGRRQSRRFQNEQDIKAGEFFILNGVLIYVAELNDPHVRNGKRNARLRLIFDNGTEGKNLLRSLATELYKDPNGRRITNPEAGPLFDKPETLHADDQQTGTIYVVRSLSPEPDISQLDGQLFKIGVTTGSVKERISTAKDDPTFLMASVYPVRTFTLINADPKKVEKLIHRFFADGRLDIEILDRFGKAIHPREWFLIPLPLIEQAIKLLMDGSIVDYKYDSKIGEIVRI
jgi:hypothetical protein